MSAPSWICPICGEREIPGGEWHCEKCQRLLDEDMDKEDKMTMLRNIAEVSAMNSNARRAAKHPDLRPDLIVEFSPALEKLPREDRDAIICAIADEPIFNDDIDASRDLSTGFALVDRHLYIWELRWAYPIGPDGSHWEECDPYQVPQISPKLEIESLDEWLKFLGSDYKASGEKRGFVIA